MRILDHVHLVLDGLWHAVQYHLEDRACPSRQPEVSCLRGLDRYRARAWRLWRAASSDRYDDDTRDLLEPERIDVSGKRRIVSERASVDQRVVGVPIS